MEGQVLHIENVMRYDMEGGNKGCKVRYLGDYEEKPNFVGRPQIDAPADFELFEVFKKAGLPGDFRVTFGIRVGAKGKPMAFITAVEPVVKKAM